MSVVVNFRLRKKPDSETYEWKCAGVTNQVTRDEVAEWIEDLRHGSGSAKLGDVIIEGNARAQRKRIAEYLELIIEMGGE